MILPSCTISRLRVCCCSGRSKDQSDAARNAVCHTLTHCPSHAGAWAIFSDLTRIEPWLERQGLPLLRRPGKGLVVVSTERQVRRAMVQLILESVPAEALRELSEQGFENAQMVKTRIPSGLRDRLETLPIEPCTIT